MESLVALGLDPSERCGFAIVERPPHQQERLVEHGVLKGSDMDAIRELATVIGERHPDLGIVIIEKPYMGLNPATLTNLSMLAGALRYAFSERASVDMVSPSSWRAEVLGLPARTKRDDCKLAARGWVKARFHVEPSEDEAEAICMAFFGVRRLLFGGKVNAATR